LTRSNRVAVVAGENTPVAREAIAGLGEGVGPANTAAEATWTLADSWDDDRPAESEALAHLSAGVDVGGPFLDAAATGVLRAAARGAMAIGLVDVPTELDDSTKTSLRTPRRPIEARALAPSVAAARWRRHSRRCRAQRCPIPM
jgi:basic membrane lipoprotein Med (substrate-binding protein (PBP1-ABC) superfamily)